ncbi:ubiquitin-ribosomal 60S subunit protein L40B fusion protein [Rhizophagus irregularis DAOM 197198w]|uniref:Ubiquitin-ribosomal 60S subunit protein L40B fusion protein n=1 Tax=Rhizophagus irregularis (strain DAOM 197198w) TaxID=1432141 RepID=A0A015IZQ8_RHIIW|nr:ubiquitin-ribosomal 60S subunit protein L40B fusion protein [Rhizophagus irregularis DAOM 197198w]
MAFQIFVYGINGTTSTLNDITTETKIIDIKIKVKEKTPGVEIEHLRLIFAGKELENHYTAGHYKIKQRSTLHLVVRLPGGSNENSYSSDDGVELTNEPDMITWDDDPENLRAKMPCGHAINPESLTAFCRSLVSEGKFQFFCPYTDSTTDVRCLVEWQYADIRKIGQLTDEECKHFETKISENYALRALGVQECPQQVGNVSGVPSCRACPRCGTIIEHDRNCKHMKCPCDQHFCFICLSLRDPQTGWSCGVFNSVCNIAPVQTTIPGL